MTKKYAKNPAELLLVNPAPKKAEKKDPRRVAAGKAAWKKRQQTPKKTKTMSNKVTSKAVVKTGKAMLVKTGVAAVGTIGAVRVTDYLIQRYGQNLPAVFQKYATIVFPATAGVIIAVKSTNKNAIAQGIASGMVYASVAQGIDKLFTKAESTLSDALGYKRNSMLSDRLAIGPGGQVLDANGHIVGKARVEVPKVVTAPVLADTTYSTSGMSSNEGEVYNA